MFGQAWLLILGLMVGCLTDIASSYCPQGSEWIEYDGRCYLWSRDKVNWFRAELNCRKFRGHLVSIHTQSENDLLERLTQCRTQFWIGMVNTEPSLKNQAKGYKWWDGKSHRYTEIKPRSNSYYDCVYSETSGKWYNYICQASFNYVCAAPAVGYTSSQVTSASGKLKKTGKPGTFKADLLGTNDDVKNSTELQATVALLKCPRGWQRLDSNCYLVSDHKTNYFNAQMSCQDVGATVASVLTSRENTLLSLVIGCKTQVWIGLEKARPCFKQSSKSQCWVWMDKKPFAYTDWASGHPIHSNSYECVILDGQWKVENCYRDHRFICKKPAVFNKNGAKDAAGN